MPDEEIEDAGIAIDLMAAGAVRAATPADAEMVPEPIQLDELCRVVVAESRRGYMLLQRQREDEDLVIYITNEMPNNTVLLVRFFCYAMILQ